MHIAVCMADGVDFSSLKDDIADHGQTGLLHWDYYHNLLDFLDGFVPGRYHALIFDGLLSPKDLAELKQADRQLRLIALVSQWDTAPRQGIWSFLPSPPTPLFIRSVLERLQAETAAQDSASMVLKTKGSVLRIPFSNIAYVEALERNVIFHLTDGKQEKVTATFSVCADHLLERPEFVKTHRSYVVNLCCVRKLTTEGVLTDTGDFVPVSKAVYPQFKKVYMESLMLLPEIETKVKSTATTTKNAPHILLVDDDSTELIRWGNVLLAQGCTLSTAQNKETALHLLGKERYDCVILDVQLGSESGFDLHQAIRHLTHAPIVYLSTLGDFEHQARGFQGGGVDYITKDVSGELFWLKVQSRIQASPPSRVCAGRLSLEMGERTASLGGALLPLTAVEFNLLHLFVQHPTQTFSPTELYQRIWGNDMRDNGQVIQLHLSALSGKLNQASPQHRYLEAVWGQGYRFVPDRQEGV